MFENRSRNHFTIIFERVGIIIFLPFLIGFGSVQNYLSRALRPEFWKDLGQNILSADRSLVSLGALIYVFLFALTLIAAVLYWLRTSFCVKEDLFIFERATFFKKTVKLPLANIATVNIERNLFERLVGTAKLKLDLNSAHTANKTDFVLVLPLDRAMALQAALTAFKKSDIIEEAQEAKLISNYSALSAARHKILSLPVFQIILGLFVLFSGKRDAGAGSDDLKNSLIFLLILSVGYGFSLIYSVLNLSDFKLLSDNKYFYISSGKLKKFHYTFARNKINALLLRQPTLARLFKLGSLEAAVVGLGNERSETPRLSLLAKREDLEIIVRDYFPDFDLWGPQKQSHKAGLIPVALITALFCGVAVLYSYYFGIRIWIPLLVAFLLTAPPSYMGYKSKGLAFNDQTLSYSKGIFTRQRGIFKYGDIQDARIITNPLMGKFGAGKLSFHILSSSRMRKHTTGWFDLESLRSISKNISAHADRSASLFE